MSESKPDDNELRRRQQRTRREPMSARGGTSDINSTHAQKQKCDLLHRPVLGSLAVLLVSLPAVRGQFTRGGINGRVLDPSGRPVGGATVSLEDLDSQATQIATADSCGTYTFAALQPHPYRITASASGFSETTVNVTLGISQQLVEDFQLRVGQTSPQVTVLASASQVALRQESNTVSQQVTQTEINSLPVDGRNFLGLAWYRRAAGRRSHQLLKQWGERTVCPDCRVIGRTRFLSPGWRERCATFYPSGQYFCLTWTPFRSSTSIPPG
jgi:hypothetical protein